ncbi:MFS transporter [Paenibacillus provencensis]|uniref:MFS transporter n=1 Tax=Paenibacillus provencensis TaxID=441151 RepID=A0ABW3Q0K4_9BACL|nr:MFS transporter [Paenibacillus sp. MER 78]MCM3129486.1 MFS transporter [Paenibacillus sp. MER 78]
MKKEPNSKLILTALFAAWIVSYIDRGVITLALSQMGQDMSLDASALGIVLSSFFVGYALMQIPGGWLADKFGSRKVIVVAILFWSLFTGLSGAAWSLASLLVIRFLFGIGEGAYPSASTKAISDYFSTEKRTKAQTTMMSSNALGGAIAPIICTPLLLWLGWRHTFLAISLLGVVLVIWFLYITRGSSHKKGASSLPKAEKGVYKELLRNRTLWKVMALFFFANIASWGLSSWMPTYLIEAQGIDLKAAGLVSAIPAVIAALGMLVSGRIIDRIGARAKYVVTACLFMYALFLFLVTRAGGLAEIMLCMSLAMAFGSFTLSFVFTLPHRLMKQRVVGTAFGMINFGGQAAGILSPAIMGFLILSTNSYNSAFLFLTASCLVAAIISLTIPRLNNQPDDHITDQPAGALPARH